MLHRTPERLLALILVLAVAACAPRQADRARPADGRWDIAGSACLGRLDAAGAAFRPVASPGSGACRVDTPVRLEAVGRGEMRPALTTACTMALAWATFAAEVDAIARRRFGAGLARVRHMGSFACRRMRGGGSMSLHAQARAIDIAAFELEDGTEVSVLEDWDRWGAKGRFLGDVAEAACDHFNVVLSPAHDRLHRNHFHFDIGPWQLCRI